MVNEQNMCIPLKPSIQTSACHIYTPGKNGRGFLYCPEEYGYPPYEKAREIIDQMTRVKKG